MLTAKVIRVQSLHNTDLDLILSCCGYQFFTMEFYKGIIGNDHEFYKGIIGK